MKHEMILLDYAVHASFFMVMLGVLLAFMRLIRGPSLADRVVALDTMTVLIVTFCGLYTLQTEVTAFLDVAVVLALIGFLTTAALARFIERRIERDPEDDPAPVVEKDTP